MRKFTPTLLGGVLLVLALAIAWRVYGLYSGPQMLPRPIPHFTPVWVVILPKPGESATLVLTLSYKYWDPKVDGDVPSGETLLETEIKVKAGEEPIPIVMPITKYGAGVDVPGKAVRSEVSKDIPFDESFAVDYRPKQNYDGFYVLAQQPVDPKKPAAMGDVQEARSWIQLGIRAQP